MGAKRNYMCPKREAEKDMLIGKNVRQLSRETLRYKAVSFQDAGRDSGLRQLLEAGEGKGVGSALGPLEVANTLVSAQCNSFQTSDLQDSRE